MKKTVQNLREAFAGIAADIIQDRQAVEKYVKIQVHIPRWFYFFMGNRGWITDAKKNGLMKKDLYNKPYYH